MFWRFKGLFSLVLDLCSMLAYDNSTLGIFEYFCLYVRFVQGYPQRMKLQRLLYGIYTVSFLIFTILCKCKLVQRLLYGIYTVSFLIFRILCKCKLVQRLLYGFYTVSFLIFTIICKCKLVSLPNHKIIQLIALSKEKYII